MQLTDTDICILAGAGEDLSFDCALAMRYPCAIHIFDPTPRAIIHFEKLSATVAAGKSFAPLSGEIDKREPYIINNEGFSRMFFHPYGLAAQDGEMRFYEPANPEFVSHSILNLHKTSQYFSAPVRRVSSILNDFIGGRGRFALLKIDIEGAEYQVIEDMITTQILPEILLVEFDEIHNPLDSAARDRIEHHIKMLQDASMRLIFTDVANMTFIKQR